MKYLTCRNCLYTDSPCVPEDYRLDNGAVAEICPNYKNVYDAYVELIKENNELKKRNGELAGQKASLGRWFGEAIGIIKLGLRAVNTSSAEYMSEYEHKAEAFLKESE